MWTKFHKLRAAFDSVGTLFKMRALPPASSTAPKRPSFTSRPCAPGLADALRAPRIQRRGGEFPLPGQAQQRLHLMARLVARVGRRAVRLAQRREELAQHRFRSAPLLPGLGRAPLAVSGVHRGLLVRPPVLRALRRGARTSTTDDFAVRLELSPSPGQIDLFPPPPGGPRPGFLKEARTSRARRADGGHGRARGDGRRAG